MLKKILSPADCAACRECCTFDRYAVWEAPVFSDEIRGRVAEFRPDARFVRHSGGWLYFPDLEDCQEEYSCPALAHDGCVLGDGKPFLCRIWPYMIMELGGEQVIVLASICPELSGRPADEMTQFLREGLADEIFAYADSDPGIVRPYREGYPVLMRRSVWRETR